MKRANRLETLVKVLFALLLGLGSALGLAWSLVGGWPNAGVGDVELAAPQQPAASIEPHIRLEKNPDYYDAASVAISEVTSLFIDADEAWTRYKLGELDSIAPPDSALPGIKASPTYSPQLHVYPRQCTYYYGFSTDVPPFDDPRVRAAFSTAIDRQRLISDTVGGDALPALTFAPTGTFGHVDGFSDGIGYPYSHTLAAALWNEAGYSVTTPITLAYNTGSNHQAIAEAARQMWFEAMGVSVTLQGMESSAYFNLLANGTPEQRPGIFRQGWCADYPDAHGWHYDVFVSGNYNWPRYTNQSYDTLVRDAARGAGDRLALYKQAEAYLVMTDTAIAPLYYYTYHSLALPNLYRTYRSYGAQHLDEWILSGQTPLRIAWGEPATLDPTRAEDTASINTIEQLFLGLTDFDEAGTIVPELATSWEVSPDGRQYTFTLRDDVVWTDGVTVTASDVVSGVLRALDPADSSPWAYMLDVITNAQAYRQGTITDASLVGVEAVDDTHVLFTLATPAAYFPTIAGMWFARPLPRHVVERYGDDWAKPENIVTNGPYRLAEWVQEPNLVVYTWSAGGHARPGGVYAYGVYYRNRGPGEAQDAYIVDSLPPGTSYWGDTSGLTPLQAGQLVTWEVGSLAAGAAGYFVVAVSVPQATITGSDVIASNCVLITNTVLGDDAEDNVHCSGTVDVWDDAVDVGIGEAWPEPDDPSPGEEFRYVIEWCNYRGAAAGPAWLTATLPLSTTLVEWRARSGEPFWSEAGSSGRQVAFYAPALPGDRCKELELTLRLDPRVTLDTRLENVVTIATPGDGNADNDRYVSTGAYVSVPRLDMYLEKRLHAAVPVPNGWVNYYIEYYNNGNVPAHVWITDTLPNGLTYQSAVWGGNQPDENTPLPQPTLTGQQVAWDLGDMPVGGRRWFHMVASISEDLLPGDVITNCAVLGVDGIDGVPADNDACVSVALNSAGPNLLVRKEHTWNNDGQIDYTIYFGNLGDQTVNDVWITDTLPPGTTWNNEWNLSGMDQARVVSTSLIAQVLAWQLSTLYPGDQGWISFGANLAQPGERMRWYTNTVEILVPPGDSEPADNVFTDVAFGGGEVDRAELWMNPPGQGSGMWGVAIPGGIVTVTTPYTQVIARPDPGECDGCWDADDVGPVHPGDTLTVTAGKGDMPVIIHVPDPFTAAADSVARTVSGQIGGWTNRGIEIYADWPGGYREVNTDGNGYFDTVYTTMPRSASGYVRYITEANYAEVIFHRPFQSPDLSMGVNYGHDWVGGHYEAGHTLWITVTESDGVTVKATVSLNTPGDWWTSDDGTWQPSQPDIAPGDRVFGRLDNGQTTEVRVGDVGGRVDVETDSISGTLMALWLTGTLPVECHAWDAPGWGQSWGPPVKYSTAAPDGSAPYFCQWDPLAEWDVQPGMDIGVYYYEPDGDKVINVFWEPAPYLGIDLWAEGDAGQDGNVTFHVDYWNDGDAPAENVVISATLEGMTYLTDTGGFAQSSSGDTVAWQLGSLSPDDSGSFLLDAVATALGGETVTNTVRIATTNPYDRGEEKESRWTGQVWANFVGELCFPTTYTPTGVVCPAEGCPVPQVDVQLRADDGSHQARARSDQDGRFVFSGLDAGVTYTLDFFLPDGLRIDWNPPVSDSFSLALPGDRINRLYRLRAAPRTKLVVGQVSYQGGGGVSDAMVYAYQEGSGVRRQSASTSGGSYEMYLRSGRWRLGVEPAQPGVDWYFDPAWEQWIEFSPDEAALETQIVDLSVARTDFYRVSGTVLDPDSNPPPAGSVEIDLCTERGRCYGASVEDGSFDVQVPPGLYHVWAWVEPASSLLPPLDNGFALSVEGDTSLIIHLRAQSERTASLQGRVIVTPTGQGLAGVEIQAWTDEGDRNSARADANGGYAVSLIPGYWRARPALTPQQQDSYIVLPPEQREGSVQAGQTISDVSFYVRRLDAAIRGWVVDETGGLLSEVEAVVYAERCVDGKCQVVKESMAQGGAFTLKVVGGYTYTVGVWLPAGGYVPGPSVPVQVYAGVDQTVVDVRLPLLEAGTRIWGELHDGDSGEVVYIEASVYANSPAGLGVEDTLWSDKYTYTLYVPTPATAPVTWTLGLWVNPATGYIPDPAHPSYPVVVEPGRQTIWQPLTVKKLETVIRGHAWISATQPARHVWVYARGAAGTDNAGLYLEAQTDASGAYTMPVLPGVYLVSAHMPPGLADAYLPPLPQEWRAVGDNPIDLWFRPKAAPVSISGALLVSPTGSLPAGTSLSVFGWAEDGSRAEVVGTLGSGYQVAVVSGTTWHLWAAYEDPANDAYYTSREVVVDVGGAPVAGADLTIERRGELPDAICQQVDPDRFTRISLPAQGTLPEPLIEIQAGTFSETVQVCATPGVVVPDGQRLLGFAYEMEARDSTGSLITTNFNKKMRLIFYLAEIPEELDLATLQPAFYSTARGAWVALDDAFIDAEDLFITGKTNHFSRFGCFSPPAASPASQIELYRVDLGGPTAGAAGVTYTFTATAVYTPGTASPPLPVTYTWYATGRSPVSHPSSGSVTDTLSLSWTGAGAKLITVTATSGGVTVTGTHTIAIAGGYAVFLPVVLKDS